MSTGRERTKWKTFCVKVRPRETLADILVLGEKIGDYYAKKHMGMIIIRGETHRGHKAGRHGKRGGGGRREETRT